MWILADLHSAPRRARDDQAPRGGIGRSFPVFDQFGPYFSASNDFLGGVAVRYAPTNEEFLSGLVVGRNQLGGHPTVVSVPVGERTVVRYRVRVLHWNQTRGSFALAGNAILDWNHLGSGAGGGAVVEDGAEG